LITIINPKITKSYQGISADGRTADPFITSGSKFLELDTLKVWIYDENNINPVTNDNWW
jgi:hypothetical protein